MSLLSLLIKDEKTWLCSLCRKQIVDLVMMPSPLNHDAHYTTTLIKRQQAKPINLYYFVPAPLLKFFSNNV